MWNSRSRRPWNTWRGCCRKAVESRFGGFGSFSLHYRLPRVGRNPRTGIPVSLPGKHVPHFKPGKELRERVNDGMLAEEAAGA